MTVDGADTVTLTATVTNDKNSAGVSWAISSGGGSLSSQTTTSATYTAPAATSSQQTITITATSVAKSTQTGTITITVAAKPAVTSTSANLTGAVGTAYSATLQVSGGISPYTWAVTSGTLPNCLTLNASTGAITGTPTAACAGTYNLTFTVTDSGSPTKLTGTASLTLVITAPTLTFPTSLAGGAVGTAYAASVAAAGALGASTYTLASGALPADLSLNSSTGAITGTPQATDAGTFHFTVKVVDAYGDTLVSGPLSIAITAPTITFPASLSAGAVGTAYSGSVAATGPVGATTYTLASGTLPADLSLNSSTGGITGTPKAADAGTFTFTVKVVDAFGDTATSGSLSLTITAPTLTFPSSLTGGTVGTAYSASVAASGALGASTYTLASGALPADLSLNASTGAVTGTPKASDVGTATFTIKVVDAYGDTATSGSLSITIAAAPAIAFGTAPTATATVGVAYASALSASGGAGALTYSISSGSLPTGLDLNTSTGAITGSPSVVGPVTFTAKAQDSFGDTPATQSYTITVNPGSATHFAVTAVASATAGSPVSFIVTALDAGGNTATAYAGTVTFTSTDGQATLPANSTLISGTGTFPATLKTAGSQTITATDTGTPTITGTSGAITVSAGSAASLVVTAPANATVDVPINVTVTAKDSYNNVATGFTDTVNFSSTDGSAVLPTPSTLTNGAGTFSATLKTTGSQTVTATDAANASIKGTSGAITVSNTVTITTSSIGPFDSGQVISDTLQASGGSGVPTNYSWSWAAGSGSSIPPGLSLSTAGVISGTAGTAGSYTVSVTVKDTGVTPNQTFSQNFTITINGALTLPTPNPSSLPSNGYTGVLYTGDVAAGGGSGTYCYTVLTGLPADGLSAPANNSPCGYVAASFPVGGTPTGPATVTFTLKVTDGTGSSVSRTYTITVTNPTAPSLPTPGSTVPGSATNGQSYNASIMLTGGVGPTYTWTINGTTLPTTGSTPLGASGLSSQFSVTGTSGGNLAITGNPTSTGTVSFTAQVKDNTTNLTSSTQTYSIQVNSAGSNASGQISLDNYCGSGLSLGIFTITLKDSGGNVVQTATTASDGSYTFTSVPNGTYTIVPSLTTSGPSVAFYPAAQSVTINNGDITGQNFNVTLGYTVSGTATYSGTTTSGQLYLVLVNLNCSSGSGGGNGTSIAYPFTSGGNFSIRGVPPGNYQLVGIIDPTAPTNLGEGAVNAADPSGTSGTVSSPITVGTANVTSVPITLSDPTGVAVNNAPKLKAVAPEDSGAVISFGNTGNGNGAEDYTSYTVQWATSTSGFSSSNQATFRAVGTGSQVWILRSGNANFTGSLTNGTAYYFRAMGTNSAGNSAWGYWDGSGSTCTSTSCATTATIGAPSTGNTVSGAITIPAGVTIKAGAVLYAGLYDQNTNVAYAAIITSPASGANSFSVKVPNGTSYQLFGILDQNNDGLIDAGDSTNVHDQNGSTTLSVTGNLTGQNATLPSTNTISVVGTQYESYTTAAGTTTSYALNFNIREGNKLPVAVTLTGGPNVINPVDFSNYCQGCGNVQFQNFFTIYNDKPTIGDAYTFDVIYSDGSSDTQTATVTGWNGGSTLVGAANLVTGMTPSATSSNDTPTFSWTNPSVDDSTDEFSFSLYNGSNNNQIWQIPSSNSNSNGFGNTITSITWNTDPTGSGSTPSVSSLTSGTTYNWLIQVSDHTGNEAQTWMYFVAP